MQAWSKAAGLLAEALAMDLERTPGAAVHTAYYAMHHAARAVLLLKEGAAAPTRHGLVIGRFGLIAKNEPNGPERLLIAGRDINRVYADRIASDYDVEATTTPAQAAAGVLKAKNFVAICQECFGFS